MVKYLFVILFLMCGCNSFNESYFSELLKSVTRVKLYCFKNNDSCYTLIDDVNSIAIFKEMVTGKIEELPYEIPTGKIIFYSENKKLLTVTITPSGCYYNYGKVLYKSRLSYETGMLFEEACYNVSK